MKKLIILGAGGHGKVVAEIAQKNGYSDIIFLDDNKTENDFKEYKIAGKCNDVCRYKNYDCFIAIGNNDIRRKIQIKLKQDGYNIVSLIDSGAVVSKSAIVGEGTVIMAGAVVNAGAVIGEGCIINTCSSVDHDCVIGDYVHISVGTHVAGNVKIGDNSFIGAGVTIINNVDVEKNTIIGAGAVLVSNVIESGTYVGVPARRIK